MELALSRGIRRLNTLALSMLPLFFSLSMPTPARQASAIIGPATKTGKRSLASVNAKPATAEAVRLLFIGSA
jgi:hypothetical protein